MKNKRAKRTKILFSLSNMQICGGFVAVVVIPSLGQREEHIVFAYQMWKPQFLSVVQFPFDNYHLPFSPTTFFEIGVKKRILNSGIHLKCCDKASFRIKQTLNALSEVQSLK